MSKFPQFSCIEEEHCYTDTNNNNAWKERINGVDRGSPGDFSVSTPSRQSLTGITNQDNFYERSTVQTVGTSRQSSVLLDTQRTINPLTDRLPSPVAVSYSSDESSLDSESDIFEYSRSEMQEDTTNESLQNRSTGVDKQTQGPLSAVQIRDAAIAAVNQCQGQWTAATHQAAAAPQPNVSQAGQSQMTSALYPLPAHWKINPYIPGVTDRGSSPVYQLKYLDGMLFVRQPRLPERVTFEQDKKLQEEFKTMSFLTSAKRDSLANQLCMDPKDVTRWFHNARKRVAYRDHVLEQKLADLASNKGQCTLDNSARSDAGYSTWDASGQNASSSTVSPLHDASCKMPSASQGGATTMTSQPFLSPLTINIPPCSLSLLPPAVSSSLTTRPLCTKPCREIVPYTKSALITTVTQLPGGRAKETSTAHFSSLSRPLSPSDLATPLRDTPGNHTSSYAAPCMDKFPATNKSKKRPTESPTLEVDAKRTFQDVTNKYYLD